MYAFEFWIEENIEGKYSRFIRKYWANKCLDIVVVAAACLTMVSTKEFQRIKFLFSLHKHEITFNKSWCHEILCFCRVDNPNICVCSIDCEFPKVIFTFCIRLFCMSIRKFLKCIHYTFMLWQEFLITHFKTIFLINGIKLVEI